MIRQLQMLQEAAPVLLRHLGAYAELAGQDIALTKSRLVNKLKFGAFALVGAVFSLFTICLFVVAATWDTPNRLLAIGIMAGVFFVATAVAGLIAAHGKPLTAFATVKREWGQDRLILERLLGDKHEPNEAAAAQANAEHRASSAYSYENTHRGDAHRSGDQRTGSQQNAPVDLDPLNKSAYRAAYESVGDELDSTESRPQSRRH